MALEYPNLVNAACAVTGAAATTLTFNGSSPGVNQADSSHSTTGVYDIALDQGVDATEVCFQPACSPQSAAADATITVQNVSDTVKRVRTFVGGSLSDAVDFTLLVLQRPVA